MGAGWRRKIALLSIVVYYHLLAACLLIPRSPVGVVYATVLCGLLSIVSNIVSTRRSWIRALQWIHRLTVALQANVLIERIHPHDHAGRVNLALAFIAAGDIIRFIVVSRLEENFVSEERLRWHRDVIRLERHLRMAKDGSCSADDNALLTSIAEGSRAVDARTAFCLLCDDEGTQALAGKYAVLDIVYDVAMRTGQHAVLLRSGVVSEHKGEVGPEPQADNTAYETVETREAYDKIQEELIGNTVQSLTYGGAPPTSPGKKALIELRHLCAEDVHWLTAARDFLSVYEAVENGSVVYAVELEAFISLQKRYSARPLRGLVTPESIALRLPSDDASTCFRILTQRFEATLSWADFEGCMRQLNNARKGLASTLRCNSRTLAVLRSAVLFIQLLAVFTAVLAIFNVEVLPEALVSIPFLFIPPAWNVLDAFLFLIIAHPFDVGDRVYVDGENLIVRDIGLTATTFERWDNVCVIISNSRLRSRTICNIRRSKNQQWKISFYISADTPASQLETLRSNMRAFISHNPAFEYLTVSYDEITECRFYRISFVVKHAINHQNGFFMWKVQNKFMAKLVSELKTNNIEYIDHQISVE